MEIIEDIYYNWWEVDPDEVETKDNLNSPGQVQPDSPKFSMELEKFIFTFVTVFVERHRFSGILVGTFSDFLILVNKCIITEIVLDEIQAVQLLVWGCPDTQKKSPKSEKKSKKNSKKDSKKDKERMALLLQQLFSESAKPKL